VAVRADAIQHEVLVQVTGGVPGRPPPGLIVAYDKSATGLDLDVGVQHRDQRIEVLGVESVDETADDIN